MQGFSTKQGRDYHLINKVCQDEIAPATSPSRQLQEEEEAAASQQVASTRNLSESAKRQHLLNLPLEQQRARASLPDQSTQGPDETQVQGTIPRLTLRTPVSRTRAREPEQRLHLSPSELSRDKLAEMNRMLAEQEVKVCHF